MTDEPIPSCFTATRLRRRAVSLARARERLGDDAPAWARRRWLAAVDRLCRDWATGRRLRSRSLRCGARTRAGGTCRRRPVAEGGLVRNRRCANHGGHSRGPRAFAVAPTADDALDALLELAARWRRSARTEPEPEPAHEPPIDMAEWSSALLERVIAEASS